MNTNFKAISRLTDYEANRILANRDDAIKGYTPVSIPKMEYPKVEKLKLVSTYSLLRELLP